MRLTRLWSDLCMTLVGLEVYRHGMKKEERERCLFSKDCARRRGRLMNGREDMMLMAVRGDDFSSSLSMNDDAQLPVYKNAREFAASYDNHTHSIVTSGGCDAQAFCHTATQSTHT